MPVVTLGERIKQAREAAGLSVRALAELVDIDDSVQRKVEKGACGVSAQRLALYARVLGVRSSYLLGEDTDRELTRAPAAS